LGVGFLGGGFFWGIPEKARAKSGRFELFEKCGGKLQTQNIKRGAGLGKNTIISRKMELAILC